MADIISLAGKQRAFKAREKINSAGFISHLTQQSAGREPLFLEDNDYLTMLGLLKDTSSKFDLRFYALCLMQNPIYLFYPTLRKTDYV